MSRRIDIELTSRREDGSWSWRAAGAREPKGSVEGALVPGGAKETDVFRAEIESDLDGVRVLTILPNKSRAERSGLIELLPSERKFESVTTKLARRERSGRDGRPGGTRDRRGRPPRSGGRDSEPGAESTRRFSRPRREAPPELPMRPKPKRLRAERTNVRAALALIDEAERVIAEKALAGGIPAVRKAAQEQNAAGASVPVETVVAIAERHLPKLRVAEWLDRAQAATSMIDDLDLRDLRSVVSASDDPSIARDESTRSLAAELKQALVRRQDEEMANWIADITAATAVGRVVRALKLSSQPPKAGVVFPPDLAATLAQATTAGLTPDAPTERWVALLEAAAFSPVCKAILPGAVPPVVADELVKTVSRLGSLMPQVAALFGVTVNPGAPAPRPLRPRRPATQDKPRSKSPDRTGDKPRDKKRDEVGDRTSGTTTTPDARPVRDASTAEGAGNTAESSRNTAEGASNTAEGAGNTTEGSRITAVGEPLELPADSVEETA